MDDLQILREYVAFPVVESECGSLENFVQDIIDWTDAVNAAAIKVRDHLKEPTA